MTLSMVILDLGGDSERVRKLTYFKVDLGILKDKENIKLLEEAWRRHEKGITGPRGDLLLLMRE